MGFCTICGKPLADGEVCTCQQTASQGVYNVAPQQDTNVQGTYAAPQQDVNVQGTYTAPQQDAGVQGGYTAPQQDANVQGSYAAGTQDNSGAAPKKDKVKMPKSDGKCPFAPIIENAKDMIENPLDAGSNYYKKATMKATITSLATLAVLYVLTSLFNLLGSALHVFSVYRAAIRLHIMSRGEALRYSGITGGTWVQAIFFPIIYMALMGAALIGLVFLVNKLIVKKEKIEILNIAKFCASVSLPIGISLVARFLNGFVHVAWLNGTVFAALYFAGLLLALLQAFELIREFVPDKKKYVLVLGILVIGIIVADYLIGDLFLGHFFSRFSTMPHLL